MTYMLGNRTYRWPESEGDRMDASCLTRYIATVENLRSPARNTGDKNVKAAFIIKTIKRPKSQGNRYFRYWIINLLLDVFQVLRLSWRSLWEDYKNLQTHDIWAKHTKLGVGVRAVQEKGWCHDRIPHWNCIILYCTLIAKKSILKFDPICNTNIAFCFPKPDLNH